LKYAGESLVITGIYFLIKIIKNLRFALLVLIMQVSSVFASGTYLRFEHLSVEAGLPQSTVVSILQDRQGFLWIGTQDGLVRYDGYDFKIFKHNADDLRSLSDNYIRVIFEDSKGNLWLGTEVGLNRFNPKTERFKHYNSDASDPNSLSDEDIRAIAEDNEGVLWVGTYGGGLNRFNPKTEQFSHYRFDSNNSNSLSDDKIHTITKDLQGTLWVGTDGGGLNRFNSTTEQFSHYRFDANNPNSLSNDVVRVISEDRQGTLWLGTDGGGLNRFNSKTEQFSHYRFDANNLKSLSDDKVRAVIEDQQGKLWVGTYGGGLNHFDPKTEQFNHYRSDASSPSNLSSDIVTAIIQDRQGTIWVGTDSGGLNRFNPKSAQFGHYRSDVSDPSSLNHDIVRAISVDPLGTLWVGTFGGGLSRFDRQTEQFKHYLYDGNNQYSLSNDIVMAITHDHQGTMWVGTADGLNRFEAKTEHFSHYRFDASNPNSLSNDIVRVITEDQEGTLWVGTYGGGINLFNPNTEQFSHYRFDASNPHSLSNDNIYAITKDHLGAMWVGTDGGGLNRFDPKTGQFSHFRFDARNPSSLSNDTILAITEDHQGTLWVGTVNGLNRLDQQTGQFRRFTDKEGLPNNVVYRIEEDNDGLLWLSTNQGLARFNPKTEHFKNYNVGDGLQSNEFNGGASFKSKEGELFFGGINGFNRFFPDKISDNKQKPVVVFTDMLLLNQSVPIGPQPDSLKNKTESSNNRFHLQQAIHSTSSLTLSHLENLVSFEFSTLHFSNPKKNQYAYRLEGFDNNWIKTDYKNRRATYTNIPSGDYILRVIASNSDDVWNEKGVSLNITVLPPPWLSWWAYSIYAAILIGLLFVFVRIQRNKVLFERHLSEQLERKVAERTDELQQANSKLEEVSVTDQLTGLKNRRYLINNVDQDIALVTRSYRNFNENKEIGEPKKSDLIFFIIDFDHFKQVNDVHGHTAGDTVLIQVKEILEQVFRETDYLVRWGGEEFLVIARFVDRHNAGKVAERLRLTVEKHSFDIGDSKELKKTCSIGFASYPFLQQETAALDWLRVVDVADHCLYAAKKSGRNAWVGIDSTASCLTDDLFTRVTEQTQSLIQAKELNMFTSISEHKKVIW
jgi:diguanylate cyclase (GGDEF)-like protein